MSLLSLEAEEQPLHWVAYDDSKRFLYRMEGVPPCSPTSLLILRHLDSVKHGETLFLNLTATYF
jgi:hypothetical protein